MKAFRNIFIASISLIIIFRTCLPFFKVIISKELPELVFVLGGDIDREIAGMEIAKTLNISTRTVHRVLNQNNQQDQKFVLELKNQNIIRKSQLISMRN